MGLNEWQFASSASQTSVIAAWLVWSICLPLAASCWRREHISGGQLIWTGEQWFWRDPQGVETAQALKLLLDIGGGMVLRMTPSVGAMRHASRMVWLQRPSMPLRWHGFRCAVYSRQTAPDLATNFVQGL